MTECDKSREDLRRTIRENSNKDNYLRVAAVFNCIGLGFEDAVACVLEHLQGGADAGDVLISWLDERIAKNEFISTYYHDQDNYLLRNFDIGESTIYKQIRMLISGYGANTQAVESNYQFLKGKKRQSKDQEAWNEVLKEFSSENFMMASMTQKLMDKLPIEISLHVTSARLNDIPARFANQVFMLYEGRMSSAESSDSFEGNGHDYEHYIASIISRHLPGAKVEVTKASGDQGADIIVEIDRSKIVVQTKLYDSAVGNDAVQQVYAAKRFYTATAAVVVTNSSFTKSANELAESLQVVLLHEDDVGPMFNRAFS